jgi:hypothetical protein
MAVVKVAAKFQTNLQNKRFPSIYLGSSKDHKSDTNLIWNHTTNDSIESNSSVLLKKIYGDFHKLYKSVITMLFGAITDKLSQMCDMDEDFIPLDEDRNNLPNKTHVHFDANVSSAYEASYVLVNPTMIKANVNDVYDNEDEEDFPPII